MVSATEVSPPPALPDLNPSARALISIGNEAEMHKKVQKGTTTRRNVTICVLFLPSDKERDFFWALQKNYVHIETDMEWDRSEKHTYI